MRRQFSTFSLLLSVAFFCLGFFPQNTAWARIGVGVGTAKIELDEDLKPGGIYPMPPLTVRNTGDEDADYMIDIQYHEGVPELRPEKEWFNFNPNEFSLAAGESRVVEVSLHLPMKVTPGKYFCYAEASPTKKSENAEGAVIGIAAAAKVYFTVVPANLIQGFYYKLLYIWKFYAPWSYTATIIFVLLSLWLAFKRKFSFNVSLKKKDNFSKKVSFVEQDSQFEQVFAMALSEMERYTSSFSPSQAEQVFEQAREMKKLVFSFFYSQDPQILHFAGEELKNILLLSQKGLSQIERNFPNYSKKARDTVIFGLTGEKQKQ